MTMTRPIVDVLTDTTKAEDVKTTHLGVLTFAQAFKTLTTP